MDDLWQMEGRLWTEGASYYRDRLDPGCLMVFAGIGVLSGADGIVATVTGPARWARVAMTGRHTAASDGLAVLAYSALAERDGAAPYAALCSSTWVRRNGDWRLVQHQQTPTGS